MCSVSPFHVIDILLAVVVRLAKRLVLNELASRGSRATFVLTAPLVHRTLDSGCSSIRPIGDGYGKVNQISSFKKASSGGEWGIERRTAHPAGSNGVPFEQQ